MFPPSVAVAGAVLATLRSAGGPTICPLTVAVLFAGLGSAVLLLTEAVSEKFAPGASVAGAETTRVKLSRLPGAMSATADSVTGPAARREIFIIRKAGPRRNRHRRFHRAGRVGRDPPRHPHRQIVGGGVGPRLHVAHADLAGRVDVYSGIGDVRVGARADPALLRQ